MPRSIGNVTITMTDMIIGMAIATATETTSATMTGADGVSVVTMDTAMDMAAGATDTA